MADRKKLTTCPICGYTDTADDADALAMAIDEHIRMSHNLDPATLNAGSEVKEDRPVQDQSDKVADGVFNPAVTGFNAQENYRRF